MLGSGSVNPRKLASPMRILIHGINYVPELTGIGKYTGEMAEWLAAQGHEVRVVTAPPYYPQWRIADGFANRWGKTRGKGEEARGKEQRTRNKGQGARDKEVRESLSLGPSSLNPEPVVVYRCPLWVPVKPSGLKRVLHLASFALSSFPIMLRQIFWRPDVVWVVEPPLFCAPQAWLVARLSGGKAWLHIQDYEVDAAFDLGLLKGKLLRGMVAAGERWLMRRFDRVSTISQRMVDRAVSKGVPPERVVMFRNWVEIMQGQDARGKGQGSGYRDELGIAENAVVALYSGNMGGKQGLEILAEVARLQAQGERDKRQEARGKEVAGASADGLLEPSNLNLEPEVIFVFCGNGAGRDELVARCDGLSNVHFLDLQPVERLSELLAMADIHLLPQRADAADLVMPSKLTGMLASGRPVVATAHPDTELAMVVMSAGMAVPPDDVRSFSDAIYKLACAPEMRAMLGQAGRRYAETHLDKQSVLSEFERQLVGLVRSA